ncbi:preprotein translocase subunit SecE [Phenylobacterium sp.]|uniref:preprotein translocase subunit SecE n=1 Tax=Phenylobacterium sp. TaxID=1871053 RepID=UPI0035B3EBD0
MARKPGSTPQAMKSRAAKTAAVMSPGSTLAQAEPKKRTSPAQFLKEVRAEARKITWTTRKETWITSVMVGIMVVIAALFFWVVDWVLGMGMSLFLQLTNAG